MPSSTVCSCQPGKAPECSEIDDAAFLICSAAMTGCDPDSGKCFCWAVPDGRGGHRALDRSEVLRRVRRLATRQPARTASRPRPKPDDSRLPPHLAARARALRAGVPLAKAVAAHPSPAPKPAAAPKPDGPSASSIERVRNWTGDRQACKARNLARLMLGGRAMREDDLVRAAAKELDLGLASEAAGKGEY